jgi:hypothetical protein
MADLISRYACGFKLRNIRARRECALCTGHHDNPKPGRTRDLLKTLLKQPPHLDRNCVVVPWICNRNSGDITLSPPLNTGA